MIATDRFAPLTARLIRWARDLVAIAEPSPGSPGRGGDLRLFLAAWAAGFLFFLVFLA